MSASSTKLKQTHEKVKRKQTDLDGSAHKKCKLDVEESSTLRDSQLKDENDSFNESRDQILFEKLAQLDSPKFGQIVNRRDYRRAGKCS